MGILAKTKLAEKVAVRSYGTYGFDPATILMIIKIITTLLELVEKFNVKPNLNGFTGFFKKWAVGKLC